MRSTTGFLGLLSVLIVLTSSHAADIPVGADCTMRWTAPTKNSDGTPLANLKEYRLFVRPATGAYDWTKPAGPPIPAPLLLSTCAAMGVVTDGRYAAVVKAVNLVGVQSAPSNEVIFVRNTTLAPEAPQTFEVIMTLQGTMTVTPMPPP